MPKAVIRIRTLKNRQHNCQRKSTKDKQRSRKHTYKTKDRVTWTPVKPGGGGELGCSGRVDSSCSTSDTCRDNLVTNRWYHEWGKDREVFMTSGTCPLSFVTQIFYNGQPSLDGEHKTFNITKRNLWFSSFLVSSNLLSRKSGHNFRRGSSNDYSIKVWF